MSLPCFKPSYIWLHNTFRIKSDFYHYISILFFLNFLMFIFLECVQGREEQKEMETQYPKQAPGSELSPQLMNWAVRSRPEPKLDAQLTEPPRLQGPIVCLVLACSPLLCYLFSPSFRDPNPSGPPSVPHTRPTLPVCDLFTLCSLAFQ